MAKLKIKTKKELKQRNLQTYTETTKAALAVQRWYRGYVARKEVNRIRNATIQLQAGARGMLSRKRMQHENEQAAKIQCLYRGHRARRRVNEKVCSGGACWPLAHPNPHGYVCLAFLRSKIRRRASLQRWCNRGCAR